MDTDPDPPPEGWTLREAFDATVDREALHRIETLNSQLSDALSARPGAGHWPDRPSRSWIVREPRQAPSPRIESLRLDIQQADAALIERFFRMLLEGHIAARGALHGQVQRIDIAPDLWSTLRIIKWSVAEDRQRGLKFHDVRVFRAEAPKAITANSRAPTEKYTEMEQGVLDCIIAIWPAGIPARLSAKVRNHAIRVKAKELGLPVAQDRKIREALARIREDRTAGE